MIICVPFAGKNVSPEVFEVMLASCKRAMPDVEVWQLTDEDTPLVADKAVRMPMVKNWGVFFFDHLINLPEDTEILRLDYDLIVQKDVREVFNIPFDVALTRRPLNDVTCSNSMRALHPHNHGVVFMRRARKFFQVAKEKYLTLQNDWMDVSEAMCHAAADHSIRWIELPGERYNYTPKRRDEDVSYCSIVHYKGDRKSWMVDSPGARSDGQNILSKLKMA